MSLHQVALDAKLANNAHATPVSLVDRFAEQHAGLMHEVRNSQVHAMISWCHWFMKPRLFLLLFPSVFRLISWQWRDLHRRVLASASALVGMIGSGSWGSGGLEAHLEALASMTAPLDPDAGPLALRL
jgi:hypothetical protein